MIGLLTPIVFMFTVGVAKIFIFVYNWICKTLYDRKMEALLARKQTLERELAQIQGKKNN